MKWIETWCNTHDLYILSEGMINFYNCWWISCNWDKLISGLVCVILYSSIVCFSTTSLDSALQSGLSWENHPFIQNQRWHFVAQEIHQGYFLFRNSFMPILIPPSRFSFFISKFHLALVLSISYSFFSFHCFLVFFFFPGILFCVW